MPHAHHSALGSFGSVLLTVIVVFTALVYLRGWRQLRSTPVSVSGSRMFGFLVGLSLIWAATASPIAALDHDLLTVHMLKHLLLMTMAPPLIWLGEPVRVLLCGLPQRSLRKIGPAFQLPLLHRLGHLLGRPQVCWLAASAALVLWHIPAIFALGIHSAVWHFVEQLSFLAAGLLFWWPVVQPWPSASIPDLSMILYLFFATLPCDILSGFLVFCDRVVYPVYSSSSHLLGFSALGDQQCAAALMWTCVTVVYLVAGVALTLRLLSPRHVHDAEFALITMRRVSGRLEALQHGD
ncbi:MAG TPA: cytochrome c oxidase assembly protein [Terriglobales bacterium]|nr:cytochrome c oxidase assembly protein [Terriglobales bacterium]